MELKDGHYYEACESCNEIFELPRANYWQVQKGKPCPCGETAEHVHVVIPFCEKCRSNVARAESLAFEYLENKEVESYV